MSFDNDLDLRRVYEATGHIQRLADRIEKIAQGAWQDAAMNGINENHGVWLALRLEMENIQELSQMIDKFAIMIRLSKIDDRND